MKLRREGGAERRLQLIDDATGRWEYRPRGMGAICDARHVVRRPWSVVDVHNPRC